MTITKPLSYLKQHANDAISRQVNRIFERFIDGYKTVSQVSQSDHFKTRDYRSGNSEEDLRVALLSTFKAYEKIIQDQIKVIEDSD